MPRLRGSRSCRSNTTCSNTRSTANILTSSVPTPFSSRARIEQIAGDAIEADGLTLDGVEVALARVLVELAVHAQRLDVAADRRQRRLEFVRDVGQHPAPRLLRRAQGFVRRAALDHRAGRQLASRRHEGAARDRHRGDRDRQQREQDGCARGHGHISAPMQAGNTGPWSFHVSATLLQDPEEAISDNEAG